MPKAEPGELDPGFTYVHQPPTRRPPPPDDYQPCRLVPEVGGVVIVSFTRNGVPVCVEVWVGELWPRIRDLIHPRSARFWLDITHLPASILAAL